MYVYVYMYVHVYMYVYVYVYMYREGSLVAWDMHTSLTGVSNEMRPLIHDTHESRTGEWRGRNRDGGDGSVHTQKRVTWITLD